MPVSYRASTEALIRAVLAQWRGKTGSPRIAIVDWAEVPTLPDQEILREAFLSRGVECALVDPREMEISGGRLYAAGAPVDLVYERAVLSELVAREDEVRAYLEAYEGGLCSFVNSFRCRITEDKAFFAILTDEAFRSLMSEDESAFLTRVLPWTRRVAERHTLKDGREVDLVPFILASREELVLKPAHDHGGHSVFLGSETTPEEWEAAARAALDSPWVVQERVRHPRGALPCREREAGT